MQSKEATVWSKAIGWMAIWLRISENSSKMSSVKSKAFKISNMLIVLAWDPSLAMDLLIRTKHLKWYEKEWQRIQSDAERDWCNLSCFKLGWIGWVSCAIIPFELCDLITQQIEHRMLSAKLRINMSLSRRWITTKLRSRTQSWQFQLLTSYIYNHMGIRP